MSLKTELHHLVAQSRRLLRSHKALCCCVRKGHHAREVVCAAIEALLTIDSRAKGLLKSASIDARTLKQSNLTPSMASKNGVSGV